MQLSKAIQNISTFKNNKRNVQKFKISYKIEANMNYCTTVLIFFKFEKYNKNQVFF